MKRWLLWTLPLLSTSAFAAQHPYRQSLLQHGIKASAFGEVALQQDRLMDYNLVSARLQGGWLLWRSPYVSTTIGAAYTGLGAQVQKAKGQALEIGYYGPVLDVIVMPEKTVKGFLSYGYENGFIKRMEKAGDRDYAYSALKLQELRAGLLISVGRFQQITLGVAEQQQKYQHFYRFQKDDGLYRRRGEAKDRNHSYFLGARLAAF